MCTYRFVFFLLSLRCVLCALELNDFTINSIDYQWDRRDKQQEALSVYVAGFQYSYRQLGLGDCEEHFKYQVIEEERLAHEDPENNRWLVALDGDKVVGMAIFEFHQYPQIYIREVSVLPEYRRRGIGRELCMAAIYDHAVERISIVTRRVNHPAVNFYKTLNFQETCFQHKGYDPDRYIGMEWIASKTSEP